MAGLRDVAPFEVSVSAYPEMHPESHNWDAEIDNLKRKVDAGATRAITQFFFEADTFLRFVDRVETAGIDIPIVPGIMLQPNFAGLKRMADMCGINVPDSYEEAFAGREGDPEACRLIATSLAYELTADLYNGGIRDFHFYTLNRAELAVSVSRALGLHEQLMVDAG